jgi:hypothetical protein
MSGMDMWEARDLLTRRDPERALKAHAVDPLPPRPKPCTCPDEDKVEVPTLSSLDVPLLCVGRCR